MVYTISTKGHMTGTLDAIQNIPARATNSRADNIPHIIPGVQDIFHSPKHILHMLDLEEPWSYKPFLSF